MATEADAQLLTNFQYDMCLETENKHLDKSEVKIAIERLIKTPKLGCYFVAYDDNDADKKMIGSTMITFEMSPVFGGLIHWIQSVYVVPEARKKGVFRSLYNTVVEAAKANPEVKCVRLYVEKENLSAQSVYEKLGMSKMDTYDFDEIDYVLGDK